jgi:hypothetical protein
MTDTSSCDARSGPGDFAVITDALKYDEVTGLEALIAATREKKQRRPGSRRRQPKAG